MKRDAKAKEALAKLRKPTKPDKPVSKGSMEHLYERRRHP